MYLDSARSGYSNLIPGHMYSLYIRIPALRQFIDYSPNSYAAFEPPTIYFQRKLITTGVLLHIRRMLYSSRTWECGVWRRSSRSYIGSLSVVIS